MSQEKEEHMPVKSFSFKESLLGTSIYISPDRTGLSLSPRESAKVIGFFVCFVFPSLYNREKQGGGGDCVWLLGGQSTESFTGLLTVLGYLKGIFPRPVLVAVKSTICSAVDYRTANLKIYSTIFLGTWIMW